MNSLLISFIKLNLSLVLTVSFMLASTSYHSQFINNSKGEILNGKNYFNPLSLKRKRIKTISVTYFKKKELQGINQIKGKSTHYLLDKEGRTIRYYFTQNSYKKDTTVEWYTYKNNKLLSVNKGNDKRIEVKTVFYDEDKEAIYIKGLSNNISTDRTLLKINSYIETTAEYITHSVLKNGDQVSEWSYTDRSVFKKLVVSQIDSTTLKETYSFPSQGNDSVSYEYSYTHQLLTQIIEKNSGGQNYTYVFYYDTNKNLVGYSKNSAQWQTEIEKAELLYNEGTGNLQAILIKNKINNSIEIRKYKYTYF